MPASLKSSSHGQTMVLTLSNPENRNALGPEMYAAGIEALQVAETSADVRSVVIAGEGSIFCAGGNLKRLKENREQPREHQAQSIEQLHGWIEAISTFPKPVLAAVEGAAAGAGFSLALACDMIVAADDAVFVMAYSTIALSPDGGGSWSLSRGLPPQLVKEWLMLGERVSAQRLHGLGLVNRLSPAGEALSEALSLADRIVILRDGRLIQTATPHEMYDAPANAFVASFIGSPEMNIHSAERLDMDGQAGVRVVPEA